VPSVQTSCQVFDEPNTVSRRRANSG
jgi:hypothetical protein